jgi:hypothetical protein
MAKTIAELRNEVLLYCPSAGPFLARTWVQNALQQATDWHPWSHLRAETLIQVRDAVQGTISAVKGSVTVTGVGLTVTASMLGRQLRTESLPIYTIIAVDTVAGTLTLDLAFAGATDAAVLATVLDAYVLLPENFHRWAAIGTPNMLFPIRWWVTEQTLNRWDPMRMQTGQPYALVSRGSPPVPSENRRPRCELWPYSLSARTYPAIYIQHGADLTDTAELYGPFAERHDVIVTGALAKAAAWPGPSVQARNPYFDLRLSEKLSKEFREALDDLAVHDEDLYPTSTPEADYGPYPTANPIGLREYE